MTVGEWVRSERLRLGLTQEGLAEKVGVVPPRNTVIWRWEQGVVQPSYANLVELCRVFGTLPPELAQIFDGHDPPSTIT